MAQYKVPQDVEADDKLIGPFSFRQFVYIMIAFGLAVACFFLWQIFPLLIIIPLPIIILLGILALPIKKDQPMETYLSAVVDFYTKPQKRYWMPGQIENSITISAPKQTENDRSKGLSQEEVSRRLSFLADVVDTEGRSIHDSNLRDDIAAEANEATDIFETNETYNIDKSIQQSTEDRHRQLVEQMRTAINQHNALNPQAPPTISHNIVQPQPIAQPAQPVAQPQPVLPAPQTAQPQPAAPAPIIAPAETPVAAPTASVPPIAPPSPTAPAASIKPDMNSAVVIQPDLEEIHEAITAPEPPQEEPTIEAPEPEPEPEPIIAEPEPIEPEPESTDNEDNQEVYISLH